MASHSMTSPQTDSVQFEAAVPRVTLRNHFAHPYDSAIAAARTCYAPRIIGPEEITDKQRLQIGAATFFGGHHTVYQHAHFEFGLENVWWPPKNVAAPICSRCLTVISSGP